jgi:hypothetical protein
LLDGVPSAGDVQLVLGLNFRQQHPALKIRGKTLQLLLHFGHGFVVLSAFALGFRDGVNGHRFTVGSSPVDHSDEGFRQYFAYRRSPD